MHIFLAGLVLLLVGATTASGSESKLERGLTPLINGAPRGAVAGVAVYDLDAKVFRFRHNHDAQLRMASVAKLMVSAAALEDLGVDYRFRTSLVGLGSIDADGSLPGLGVIGRGDPCLDEHFTDRRPDRIFTDWAAALKQAGVQRIDGDLVIDTAAFSGPAHPPTYPQKHKNRQAWYSAPASAFAWNDNCIEVRVRPGKAGGPAIIDVRPRSARIAVSNKAKSVSSGGSSGIIVSRDNHANRVIVGGSYSKPTSWFPMAIHNSPDLLAGDHFKAILIDQGIPVSGEVRIGTVEESPGRLLHEHSSPLLPALTILNTRSQNFYGEQILRVIGRKRLGAGSVEKGSLAVTEALTEHLDLPAEHLNLIDGSGLSYDNRASAWYVCKLLDAMADSEHAEDYRETLKAKWSGTHKAQVKTGSLNVARCLAGYISTDQGRFAFAILLNKGESSGIGWASNLRDKLFHAIVAAVD
jgi:D-alanyl-D-alanine carboxypeptidase/D-alanyl-D-alanine-endopeptidase (penicillin-binding protein 4)